MLFACLCIPYAFSSMMPQQRCLGTVFAPLASQANRRRPRWMKAMSVKVPALKDLLDRPLDLGAVQLVEAAMRNAGFGEGSWSPLTDGFKSLRHGSGSSPEPVLDLLCFLNESSDEKMQQMDLDDVTVEQVAAARSALRKAIGEAELAVKKGRKTWYCRQVAPWLWPFRFGRPRLGSKDLLSNLRAADTRASILMTRLEEEAQKENNAACLQEVATELNCGFFAFDPQMIKIWIHCG